MCNIAPKRRALCLALISAMLCPDPALARVVPDIDLGTITILKERKEIDCKTKAGAEAALA